MDCRCDIPRGVTANTYLTDNHALLGFRRTIRHDVMAFTYEIVARERASAYQRQGDLSR
jgi:hypothetical protein